MIIETFSWRKISSYFKRPSAEESSFPNSTFTLIRKTQSDLNVSCCSPFRLRTWSLPSLRCHSKERSFRNLRRQMKPLITITNVVKRPFSSSVLNGFHLKVREAPSGSFNPGHQFESSGEFTRKHTISPPPHPRSHYIEKRGHPLTPRAPFVLFLPTQQPACYIDPPPCGRIH